MGEVLREDTFPLDLGANPALIDEWLTVGVGSRIVRENPPAAYGPGPLEHLVDGWTEVLTSRSWRVDVAPSPASPWRVFVVGDQVRGRLDTAGSELALPVDDSATELLVATDPGKRRWITIGERPQDFPFHAQLGGEVVRVDAIGDVLNANPWMSGNVTGWTAQNCTLTYSTAQTRAGYGSMLVTPNGSSASGGAQASTSVTVVPDATYLLSMWVYSPGGWSGGIAPAVDWFTDAGGFISASVPTPGAIPAGVWTPLTATVTAPSTAVGARVRARHAGTPAGTDVWYVTALMIQPQPTGSPQTFTVGRSLNGVVKAHPAGSRLRIAHWEV